MTARQIDQAIARSRAQALDAVRHIGITARAYEAGLDDAIQAVADIVSEATAQRDILTQRAHQMRTGGQR